MLRGQIAVFAVERGHLGGQGPGIPAIVDHVIRHRESLLPRGLGPQHGECVLPALAVACHQPPELVFLGAIDDQDAVHDALEMALHEERNHEDLIRTRRRMRLAFSSRGSRMQAPFDLRRVASSRTSAEAPSSSRPFAIEDAAAERLDERQSRLAGLTTSARLVGSSTPRLAGETGTASCRWRRRR